MDAIVGLTNLHSFGKQSERGDQYYICMELKIKRLVDNAIMPIKAHATDAGFDLTAVNITPELNESGQYLFVYHSGIAVEIPEGYVGLLFQRSSVANKSIMMTNCVGVIDSGYRGEIIAKFKATTDVVPAIYKVGEKFAQLVIVPIANITEIKEVTELSDSDRGEGGYGSSDIDVSAATEASVNKEDVHDDAQQESTTEQAAASAREAETVE